MADRSDPRYIAYSDPLQAARGALYRHRCLVPDHVLREVVEAVLATADRIVDLKHIIVRQAWETERYRESERIDMRRRLLYDVADVGLIPTDLPTETLRYFTQPPWAGDPSASRGYGEVPADAVEAGTPWEWLQLCLSVPARIPAVRVDG